MRRSLFLLWLCLLPYSILAMEAPQCLVPAAYSSAPSASCASSPMSYWAALLGWQPVSPTSQNLCGGYYAEPASISSTLNPPPIGEALMHIASTGPMTYGLKSVSVIEGNVTMLQPGRAIRADKVILTPKETTGQLDQIDLQGNVSFQEAGRLVVGDSARIELNTKAWVVKQAAYHVVQPSMAGPRDAWGTAQEAHHESALFSWFKRATYTTCAPTNPAWHIKSAHLALHKDTGRGTAKPVVFYIKNTPVFYLPYLSFPIDKQRYSGFLYPNVGYDSQSGAFIGVPYYFDLAPNYDDTLTVTPLSKRGVMANNLFRYLTARSSGSLQLGFLPDDKAFSTFKQTQLQQYTGNEYYSPFLAQLNNSSNNRAAISFHHDLALNTNWSSSLEVNYVTDDYYFQDLGGSFAAMNADQLFNQAAVSYQGEHWLFSGRVQAWQTLHPLNQTFAADQYQRLPELTLSSFWPDEAYGLNYRLNSEWVHFAHADDFFTGAPYPTGDRLHLNLQASLPFTAGSAFLTPILAVDTTHYSVNNNSVLNTTVAPAVTVPDATAELNKTRALPILAMDSGLYFERSLQLAQHLYNQTLEPRLFYLFVPMTNQDNIPIFDTNLPPFSFDELFRINRFMGDDRVGDANQLSVGLTSRLLDGFNGEDKVEANLGGIYYFYKHRVCLYPSCVDDPTINGRISPLTGQLTYHLNPQLSMSATAAWDPNQRQMNNDGMHAQYRLGPKRIVSMGYDYIKNGDVLNTTDPNSATNNLHRLDFSVSWPLPHTERWSTVIDWNYNISHAHPQTYLYGLEYNSCCWAMRVVSSRALQTEDSVGNVSFRSTYYLQFLFKGLGSVGNVNGGSVLSSVIPGYSDAFKN